MKWRLAFNYSDLMEKTEEALVDAGGQPGTAAGGKLLSGLQ